MQNIYKENILNFDYMLGRESDELIFVNANNSNAISNFDQRKYFLMLSIQM